MATKQIYASPADALPADADTNHPYFGKGGSYSFDPATGQTTLLERAGLATDATADAAPTNTTQE
jgi:hypothetical protein